MAMMSIPPVPAGKECAVCSQSADAYSHQAILPIQLIGFGNVPSGGILKLATEILGILRSEGRFEVGGLESFWDRFDHHLCSSCRNKLERRKIGLSFVRYLLQEALRLDPGNDQARKNLDIIS